MRAHLWGWYLWHLAREAKAQESLASCIVSQLAEAWNRGKRKG